jgi:hypothetical protein
VATTVSIPEIKFGWELVVGYFRKMAVIDGKVSGFRPCAIKWE